MSNKSPRLTATKVIKILEKHGFQLVSQKGSHQKWRNNETRKQVIVPMHKGKDLPVGALKAIMSASGIDESMWS